MASVFISYAKVDRSILDGVLRLLSRPWRTVFWDNHLETGATWSRVLHEQLFAAQCVVVLWSRNALKSGWVLHEATIALERRVIVSVIVDDLAIEQLPHAFRHPTPVLLADPSGRGAEILAERVRRVRARSSRRRVLVRLAAGTALGVLILLAWPLLSKVWQAGRAGILGLEYGQRSTQENETLGHAVQSAHQIDLLMPDANEWTQLVTEELRTFFREGGKMRVLFAVPGGTFDRELAMMTAGPNRPYREYLLSVRASVAILQSDADTRQDALEIRYFDQGILASMIVFDGATCQLTLTLPPGAETESMRLELNRGGALQQDCVPYFESAWRRSMAQASP